MQPKSANTSFEPLKPPQDAAVPETTESADFETSIEAASLEVSSAVIMEPLKPPQ